MDLTCLVSKYGAMDWPACVASPAYSVFVYNDHADFRMGSRQSPPAMQYSVTGPHTFYGPSRSPYSGRVLECFSATRTYLCLSRSVQDLRRRHQKWLKCNRKGRGLLGVTLRAKTQPPVVYTKDSVYPCRYFAYISDSNVARPLYQTNSLKELKLYLYKNLCMS